MLWHTIANIIKKSNLSADKQAVREMNEALAQWEASSGYTAVADVETVMQILANAGYNTENWKCLTQGYEVYWYKNDNRMILYNAAEGAIEYPEQYVGSKTMVKAENGFFIYNYNHVQAQQFDISLGSSTAAGTTTFSSVTVQTKPGALNSNATNNINALSSAVTKDEVRSAIASSFGASAGSNIYMYASREIVSEGSNAYASLQVSAVGTTENPVVLKSNGELVENLYYLEVVKTTDATEAQIASAQAAAGQYMYSIFDKITTGAINDNVTIVIAPGTTIDVSSCEWAPCKTFQGYFGTTDASNPVIINGARLTSATGYSQTVRFDGSSSKYFITGFFGTVYGETTIENVKFSNLSIDSPANDYELSTTDVNGGKTSSRNTVAIIGGIIDNRNDTVLAVGDAQSLGLDVTTKATSYVTQTLNGSKYYKVKSTKSEWWKVNQEAVKPVVVLRNITVDATCSVTSLGCAGGLVGYIGSSASYGNDVYKIGSADITIDNCNVSTKVKSLDTKGGVGGYGTAAGLVGFMCRATGWECTINNCTFAGTVDGYAGVSALVGDNLTGTVKLTGTNVVSDAVLNGNESAKGVAIVSTATSSNTTIMNQGVLKFKNNCLFDNSRVTAMGTLKNEADSDITSLTRGYMISVAKNNTLTQPSTKTTGEWSSTNPWYTDWRCTSEIDYSTYPKVTKDTSYLLFARWSK